MLEYEASPDKLDGDVDENNEDTGENEMVEETEE